MILGFSHRLSLEPTRRAPPSPVMRCASIRPTMKRALPASAERLSWSPFDGRADPHPASGEACTHAVFGAPPLTPRRSRKENPTVVGIWQAYAGTNLIVAGIAMIATFGIPLLAVPLSRAWLMRWEIPPVLAVNPVRGSRRTPVLHSTLAVMVRSVEDGIASGHGAL